MEAAITEKILSLNNQVLRANGTFDAYYPGGYKQHCEKEISDLWQAYDNAKKLYQDKTIDEMVNIMIEKGRESRKKAQYLQEARNKPKSSCSVV